MADIAVLARGEWLAASIIVEWVASSFAPPPAVRQLIEETWSAALAIPGISLFDGPLCRMESWHHDGHRLRLRLSPTSYKAFLGTNGRHAQAVSVHGPQAAANALGTSAVVLSSDHWLVFGQRGPHLALYPGCAHPFGGCVEPAPDLDVTQDTARELFEELTVTGAQIHDLRCLALGSDLRLMQPELTYVARLGLTRAELAERVDASEHRGIWSVRDEPDAVAAALASPAPMTPLTRLALLVVGGWRFGDGWYDQQARIAISP